MRTSEKIKAQAANTGLAKVAVQCSADTFVVNQSLVLRINICAKNPAIANLRNVSGHCKKTPRQIINEKI